MIEILTKQETVDAGFEPVSHNAYCYDTLRIQWNRN